MKRFAAVLLPFCLSACLNAQLSLTSSTSTSSSGSGSGASSSTPPDVLTVIPQYAIAPNWNDYVKTATPSLACTGAEAGITGCIHGGEHRRVVTTKTSCAGLAMSDTLGVFDWGCSIQAGVATFDSYLKFGKGLRDLINFSSNAWLPNSVVMTGANGGYSSQAVWWGNAVSALPDNSGTHAVSTLSSPGMIYAMQTSRLGAGYNLNADGIAIVTASGAALTWDPIAPTNVYTTTGKTSTPNFKAHIAIGTQKFCWIEATLLGGAGTTPDYGILLYASVFNVIKNTSISRAMSWALLLGSSSNKNTVTDFVASSGAIGLDVNGSTDNVIVGARLSNYGTYGARIFSTGVGNNVFERVLATNNATGIVVSSASNNYLNAITAANNSSNGLYLTSSASSNVVNSALFVNNLTGLLVDTSSDLNTFSNIASAKNGTDININAGSNEKFTGKLLVWSATSCSITGGVNPGLVNATCSQQGSSNFVSPVLGVDPTNSFWGKITWNDVNNASEVNGSAAFAGGLDWLSFDNPFRAWGNEYASAFPNTLHRGNCWTGTCRIWDWSLQIADTVIRNTSLSGNSSNGPFTANAACPMAVDGSAAAVSTGAQTYLLNAAEVMNDTTSNHNGICESGENCIYLPNFGAYQGQGAFNPCTFNPGIVTGVNIYGASINGT